MANRLNIHIKHADNVWDKRFLNLAKEVSTWSKDPSTQVGAIAVKNRKVLAQGYNGFPRKIRDLNDRYNNKDEKYTYIVHAEMNVIYNATYNGVSLKDSTLYVYGLPVCSDCAKGIIQVGIKKVIMLEMPVPEKWKASFENTKLMFKEAGIEYKFIKKNIYK